VVLTSPTSRESELGRGEDLIMWKAISLAAGRTPVVIETRFIRNGDGRNRGNLNRGMEIKKIGPPQPGMLVAGVKMAREIRQGRAVGSPKAQSPLLER
jgi:hypothetical protein